MANRRRHTFQSTFRRHEVAVIAEDLSAPFDSRIAGKIFTYFNRIVRILLVTAFIGALFYFPAKYCFAFLNGYFTQTITRIDVQTNGITEADFVKKLAGISEKSSVFEFDSAQLKEKLQALPWIASATVNSHADGSIFVNIVERQPAAWLDMPDFDLPGRIPNKSLLVDNNGFLFVCQNAHLKKALDLPVIRVPRNVISFCPEAGQCLSHHSLLSALELIRCRNKLNLPELPPVLVVTPNNEWSLSVLLGGNINATFNLNDFDRQFCDLSTACRHVSKSKRRIATINLMVPRNIPTTFHSEPESKNVAVVVDETPANKPAETPKTNSLDTTKTNTKDSAKTTQAPKTNPKTTKSTKVEAKSPKANKPNKALKSPNKPKTSQQAKSTKSETNSKKLTRSQKSTKSHPKTTTRKSASRPAEKRPPRAIPVDE